MKQKKTPVRTIRTGNHKVALRGNILFTTAGAEYANDSKGNIVTWDLRVISPYYFYIVADI